MSLTVAPGARPTPREPVLVAYRVVGRPLQLGIPRTELGGQTRQGGRGKRFRQDCEGGVAICRMSLSQRPPGLHEIAPRFRRTLERDRLRAVGIVEAEHG